MSIMANITPEMATNARKVLEFKRKGHDFETSYGKAMKWLAKKEGHRPTRFRSDKNGVERALKDGEVSLLRLGSFQATDELACKMGVKVAEVRGWAQALQNRRLTVNVQKDTRHAMRAIYQITKKGQVVLSEYDSGEKKPTRNNTTPVKWDEDVLSAFRGDQISSFDIAERTGRDGRNLSKCLRRLIEKGEIRCLGRRHRRKYYERIE